MVVISSGRSAVDLDKWLGDIPGLHFGAEHGGYFRSAGSKTWQSASTTAVKGWRTAVLPVLEKYAAKTPGALVETKNTALVWHYRQAKSYYAYKNLVILKRVLKPIAKELGLTVRQGHMTLEVKAADINKANIAKKWLATEPDFAVAIGDDYTDEDTFATMPSDAYTIKVGPGRTVARYRLKNLEAVLQLLEKLSKR